MYSHFSLINIILVGCFLYNSLLAAQISSIKHYVIKFVSDLR